MGENGFRLRKQTALAQSISLDIGHVDLFIEGDEHSG
jgi:hypothetical protein